MILGFFDKILVCDFFERLRDFFKWYAPVYVEDNLVKTTSCDAGMIKATIIHALMNVVLIAHPRGKIVPVRILSSSHEPVHRQKRQTCCKW